MHRILAGNLTGKDGYRKPVPGFPDNIQIWHARLNHHHVCPLLQILGNFLDLSLINKDVGLIAHVLTAY
jgi:hypothetical protein